MWVLETGTRGNCQVQSGQIMIVLQIWLYHIKMNSDTIMDNSMCRDVYL